MSKLVVLLDDAKGKERERGKKLGGERWRGWAKGAAQGAAAPMV